MKRIKGIALISWDSRKFEAYVDSNLTVTQAVEAVREKLMDLDPRFAHCSIIIQEIQEGVSLPGNMHEIVI